jgi:hypothetical protein
MTMDNMTDTQYLSSTMNCEDCNGAGWVNSYSPFKTIAIITRTGIEKIQYANDISVSFEPCVLSKDFVVMKATAQKGDVIMETFGSAWHGEGGNCRSNYVTEMAEKRALARVVLKTTGAYKFGVFGEDESDDFKHGEKVNDV